MMRSFFFGLLFSSMAVGQDLNCFQIDDVDQTGFGYPVWIDLYKNNARYVANSLSPILYKDDDFIIWTHLQIGSPSDQNRRALVSLLFNRKNGRLAVSAVDDEDTTEKKLIQTKQKD